MRNASIAVTLIVVVSLLLAACAQATSAPAANKLEDVKNRGVLIVSSDPAYPPQSELVENATRATDTKCGSDQQTGDELRGFDIDVSKEIAKRLGVEVCFVTPAWDLITAGSWADRWDISVGSMTVTPERMENLYFTQPYYTTPAAFFVHEENTTFTQPSDLSGKKVGACSGCTYDFFLGGTLQIPGETMNYVVKDAQFTGYDTDLNALQDLALGDGVRLDGVLTAEPTGQGVIADGMPLKQLGDPVYFEYLAAALDRNSNQDSVPLAQEVSRIISEMHADGTMLKLSQQYYGLDLTTAAGEFDLDQLNQW